MKKSIEGKTATLVLGGLSILALLILIANLGSLEFQPAVPFVYQQTQGSTPVATPPTWNGIVYVAVVVALVLIGLFILLPPAQRKKFLITVGALAFVGVLIYLVLSQLSLGTPVIPQQENPGEPVISPVPGPTLTLEPEVTPSVFVPPQISTLSAFLVALAVMVLFVSIIVWLIWSGKRKEVPYEALADIARSALDDLQGGKDWGDTILNSYQRMNLAVRDWRGIHRRESMTPAEFAVYLATTQLPREAVLQLTMLFERVRYGDKKPTSTDIHAAVKCLTDILDFCQGNK